MAPYAFHITKMVTWRGKAEQFENVYHYNLSPNPSDELITSVMDEIVAKEKPCFGNVVTFQQGRAHGPTNAGAAADLMRVVKDYTGGGTGPSSTPIPYEMTTVCQWYIGRSAQGRKRFLRKYYHNGALNSPGAAGALGNANLNALEVSDLVAKYNAFKNLTPSVGGSVPICAPNGDGLPLNTDTVVLPHLHTRQFRR